MRGFPSAAFLVVVCAAAASAAAGLTVAAPPPPPPAGVTYFPADQVTAAFAKGSVLFEGPGFAVHASRRDAAGQAEVHLKETDVIHVLEGSVTFVTGGEVVEGRATAPEEIRGSSIRGGETRRLAKGDVIVVPNGVPHWFKEVPGPFIYYVVKVRDAGGDAR
ncbi:MAG TPA: cupin domain-containing protein [Candidatus Polarisedimenticolia bacterium]|nr:cupin domain-containing protein [Candidatus Polarisedimenticolia bacterium]